MKSKTLYLLVVISFFSISCQGKLSQKTTPAKIEQEQIKNEKQMIKNFYMSYVANVASSDSEATMNNVALKKKNMTKELIAKVDRMVSATGSDPIIRAQDFDLNDLNSLDVKHLEGKWYMVSYVQSYGAGKLVEIPVRVANVNGKILIDYITPGWNETLFGDQLLCNQKTPQIVDASTPISLLKTFYEAYTMQYCSMPIDLSSRLDALRKKYCTQNALDEIGKAKEKEETPGYDLLINYFDFDILWIPTLTFAHLQGDMYKVSYTKWENMTSNIYISVIKKDGAYVINSIRADGAI